LIIVKIVVLHGFNYFHKRKLIYYDLLPEASGVLPENAG